MSNKNKQIRDTRVAEEVAYAYKGYFDSLASIKKETKEKKFGTLRWVARVAAGTTGKSSHEKDNLQSLEDKAYDKYDLIDFMTDYKDNPVAVEYIDSSIDRLRKLSMNDAADGLVAFLESDISDDISDRFRQLGLARLPIEAVIPCVTGKSSGSVYISGKSTFEKYNPIAAATETDYRDDSVEFQLNTAFQVLGLKGVPIPNTPNMTGSGRSRMSFVKTELVDLDTVMNVALFSGYTDADMTMVMESPSAGINFFPLSKQKNRTLANTDY